ncbi:MAG: hypothetical protein CMB45_03045 [Euryarchaeota archaeon]|nr:hypothetical protein [Euryarchaeota archaeon]
MGSDLGKMYRRNYMVKSQLNSLEAKSRALNEKITGETKIDEWAESYITRADAQIDDVSDYMNFRNLGGLNKRMGHVLIKPKPSPALPAPKLPIYGQQRQAAPPPSKPAADRDRDGVPDKKDKFPDDPNEWADIDNDGVGDNNDLFGGVTDFLPQVTGGNTLGAVLMLGLMGATLGVVTYDEYRGKRNVKSMLVPRLKRMGIYGAGGVALAVAYQSVVGAGQKTGWY